MNKYYCCYFFSFDDLKNTLKKVDNCADVKIIAQSLEARGCSGSWIREAYNRYFELLHKDTNFA